MAETKVLEIKNSAPQMVIDKSFVGKENDKSYNVTFAEIADNQLMLEINYSGGCAEHEFQLISNGIWEKTYPPQMLLYLEHLPNGDKCREFISKKLFFNIENTQYAGTNLVILKIQNLKNQIEYTY